MKTIIIGFDAFDPTIFERLVDQGKLPNLAEFLKKGGYSRFEIANPAQSEVSWTSIATGLDAGGHGLFDFVHRNPTNYSLHVSLLPTKKQLFGVQFAPPHSAQTIFDYAVQQGYPATTLWWPATFPARLGSPVRSIPGLGTPDILGRLGVGSFFSAASDFSQDEHKTRIGLLKKEKGNMYQGILEGPIRKKRSGTQQAALEFTLEIEKENGAILHIEKQKITLMKGEWSPILQLTFRMGLGVSVHAITRVVFNDHLRSPGLFFLPLQIHPLHSPWPYATPRGFISEIWRSFGSFLTLGWPQDTTGLEEKFINDNQFLELCESILLAREHVFIRQLQNFREGILAVVFDSLDRIQHMFWRDRPDIIEEWYEKLDGLFGRILEQIRRNDQEGIRIFVISDHGFANFEHKVHLNQWLVENGYLVTKEDSGKRELANADWARTRAYAVGLSSIYANLAGREGQGIVQENEKSELLNNLKNQLLEWEGPDNRRVVNDAWPGTEIFSGPLVEHGPDLVVGFNTGYRASAQTGLGGWEQKALEPNYDHWGADHCMDPCLVPGVLLTNVDLENKPNITYREIPELMIGQEVDEFRPSSGDPPEFADEDQKILEERLKDLGYL